MIIAIDGPAGAGKSTTARGVAQALGFLYVDTGAMYRAVAWLAREAALSPLEGGHADAVAALARSAKLELHGSQVRVNGHEISGEIRTPEIAQMASQVAAIPAVREALVHLQRELGRHAEAQSGGAVLEGRDIQTVVFPDADLKVFLTADLQTRAQRRAQEVDESATALQAHLAERDARDEKREVAPLLAAPDAVQISTDGLTPEEVVSKIVALAREKAN